MTRTPEEPTLVMPAHETKSNGIAEDHDATIYFDGSCPLCTAEIAHYESQEGSERLRFVDISAADADPGPDLDREAALGRFHVRHSDGTLLSGARGFVAIWAALPRYRWAARIARIPGVTPVLEVAYRVFLPIRPVLSRIAGLFGAKARNPQACAR